MHILVFPACVRAAESSKTAALPARAVQRTGVQKPASPAADS